MHLQSLAWLFSIHVIPLYTKGLQIMADPLYGKRTGVTTLKREITFICRLLLRYGTKIRAWVNTAVDPAFRAEALSILDSLNTLCTILTAAPDD